MAEHDQNRGQDVTPPPVTSYEGYEQELEQGAQHIPGYYPEVTPEMLAAQGITAEQFAAGQAALDRALRTPETANQALPRPDLPPEQPGVPMTVAAPQLQQAMGMGFQRGAVVGTIFGGLIIGGLLVAIVNSKKKTPAVEKSPE